MIERNLLGAVFCLPLALVLWQGSSCHSSHVNANNNSARDDRRSAEANVNSAKVNHNSKMTQAPDLTGTWGGDHISMVVTQSGASIEYDCAHGAISEKIVPDRDGHFAAQGSFVREAPGPSRQGEDASGQPATYRGSLDGDTMQLTVVLSKSNETLGSFTLTHGKTGRIRKCR